ncbi:MAG: Dyp-type peroxidase [Lacipirellulaceae bacterium]
MKEPNIVQAGPLPLGLFETSYQRGIVDPMWPETPIYGSDFVGIDDEKYPGLRGKMDPQEFLTVARVNTSAKTLPEVATMLQSITTFCDYQMTRGPATADLRPLQYVPRSYRVTVTVGLGATFFMDPVSGRDRFGFLHAKPRSLRIPPRLFGDRFDPSEEQTDLVFSIASDHKYVNAAIARSIETIDASLQVVAVDEGFARPDKRAFGRFEDGISNLGNLTRPERESFIFIDEFSEEPAWCRGGSYLVFRKVEQDLEKWDLLEDDQQSLMIGRQKEDGMPLAKRRDKDFPREPLFADPVNKADGPLKSHSRAVNPRRPPKYSLGLDDMDRRFLRRGYPYLDNIGSLDEETGKYAPSSFGLLFVAYMNSISRQFEYVTDTWQMNPDFPCPEAGRDAMFTSGVFSVLTGGYYFCPPAWRFPKDFLASGLLAEVS